MPADTPANKRKSNGSIEPGDLKEMEEVAVSDDTHEKVNCHAVSVSEIIIIFINLQRFCSIFL